MKKKILIAFFVSLLLTGCYRYEESEEGIELRVLDDLENIKADFQNSQPDKEKLKDNEYYRDIVTRGDHAALYLEEMYYQDELDEISSATAALAIEEITKCNLEEHYDIKWNTHEEFFEWWKTNNCTKKRFKHKTQKEKSPHWQEQYPKFDNIVEDCRQHVPIIGNMIPQGIAQVDEYLLMTAYDYKEEQRSLCYVASKDNEIVNIAEFDSFSHVGSIAYDRKRDLIWVPGEKGLVNVYKKEQFLKEKTLEPLQSFDDISDGIMHYKIHTEKDVAFLTVDEDYLYIGSFMEIVKGKVKKYRIETTNDGNITLKYIDQFIVPPQIQSISFYNYEGQKYMLLSKSFGRKNPSFILIYKYNPNIHDYSNQKTFKKYKTPPMLEQASIYDDSLNIIFESNAKKYKNAPEKIESACSLDLKKIFTTDNFQQ